MKVKTGYQCECDFLGDLSTLDLKTEYRSLKEDPVQQFYKPCLRNSICYRRAAGYFRSTVFSVIGYTLLEFARRGGRTKLICSPELSEADVDSISLGYARRAKVLHEKFIEEIDELLASPKTEFNARLLATLIASDHLEIKVAIREDRKGLYHEKVGIFSDGVGNSVSFKGSANETWSGWHSQGNFESIEVFCSWRGGLEAQRVSNHEAHFDSLWDEDDPDVEVFSFPEKAIEHLKRFAYDDLESVGVGNQVLNPRKREPMPHQESAVKRWMAQGWKGIFEHATGSGKTFTALMAIRQHTERGRPALVLVPSKLLLDQWASEIREEVPDAALLLAGGGNHKWKSGDRLKGMTIDAEDYGGRVVLATMQTASTKAFLDNVCCGIHLLIVADEVHQIGSPQFSRILSLTAGARLGLSATPKRFGDPEGTKRIYDYFGKTVLPPITLNDAIEAGRLVPYQYYPHTVNLSAEEAEEWRILTDQIRREIARERKSDDSADSISEKVKMLLIRRARIAKKACAKKDLALTVIKKFFQEGQSWLIYCEDADQLKAVVSQLRNNGYDPIEYHSQMEGDRAATMSWFRSFGGILVSIRCLDEGIDIPDVSHAMILASSQNPRQFIQRRGRVLRRARGKQFATIHDAIVTPVKAIDEPGQMGLLKAEILRAIEFSENALNRSASAEVREIAMDMGLSPDTMDDIGLETTGEMD